MDVGETARGCEGGREGRKESDGQSWRGLRTARDSEKLRDSKRHSSCPWPFLLSPRIWIHFLREGDGASGTFWSVKGQLVLQGQRGSCLRLRSWPSAWMIEFLPLLCSSLASPDCMAEAVPRGKPTLLSLLLGCIPSALSRDRRISWASPHAWE